MNWNPLSISIKNLLFIIIGVNFFNQNIFLKWKNILLNMTLYERKL